MRTVARTCMQHLLARTRCRVLQEHVPRLRLVNLAAAPTLAGCKSQLDCSAPSAELNAVAVLHRMCRRRAKSHLS